MLWLLKFFGFWPEYDCFNGSETIVVESDFGGDCSEINYLDEQSE